MTIMGSWPQASHSGWFNGTLNPFMDNCSRNRHVHQIGKWKIKSLLRSFLKVSTLLRTDGSYFPASSLYAAHTSLAPLQIHISMSVQHLNCELLGDKGCRNWPFIPSTPPSAQWAPNGCSLNKAQIRIPAKEWSFEPQAPHSPWERFPQGPGMRLAWEASPPQPRLCIYYFSSGDISHQQDEYKLHREREENSKGTRRRSGSFGDANRPLPPAPHPLRPLHLLNIQDMALRG